MAYFTRGLLSIDLHNGSERVKHKDISGNSKYTVPETGACLGVFQEWQTDLCGRSIGNEVKSDKKETTGEVRKARQIGF